jgi:hypothetical protein
VTVALADRIKELADGIQADLTAGFDYYEHTKVAWHLFERLSVEGDQVSFQNMDTGTSIDAPGLAALSQSYVTGYLAESVFQHFVTLFEDFVLA